METARSSVKLLLVPILAWILCDWLKLTGVQRHAALVMAALPADGRHLVAPNVEAADGFYAKGQKFDLAAFLGESGLPETQRALTAEFAGGAMLISRLLPETSSWISVSTLSGMSSTTLR